PTDGSVPTHYAVWTRPADTEVRDIVPTATGYLMATYLPSITGTTHAHHGIVKLDSNFHVVSTHGFDAPLRGPQSQLAAGNGHSGLYFDQAEPHQFSFFMPIDEDGNVGTYTQLVHYSEHWLAVDLAWDGTQFGMVFDSDMYQQSTGIPDAEVNFM